jgi:hypothetical protein
VKLYELRYCNGQLNTVSSTKASTPAPVPQPDA